MKRSESQNRDLPKPGARLTATLAAIVAIAAALPSALAAPPPPAPELIRLAEAFRIAAKLGPRVWPGFTADDAPVLLVAGEHEYLLNADAAAGFAAIDVSFRGRPVFARPRIFPEALEASFPAIGRETVVIGTAEATGRNGPRWTLTAVHELFHVFQAERLRLGERAAKLSIAADDDGQWQLDHPFPYRDPRIERALHVVGSTSFAALDDDERVAERATVASEALAVLLDLLAAIYPGEGHDEYLRFAATKEGLARYFEYRVAREAAAGWDSSTPFLSLEGEDAFERAWKEHYASLPYQIKHLGRVSRSRLEFYNLGLGLALVLDRLDPAWTAALTDDTAWLDRVFLDSVAARR